MFIKQSNKKGDKSLRTLGSHIGNSLPENIKPENNLIKFREYINQWFGPICKCNLFLYIVTKLSHFPFLVTMVHINKRVRESQDYNLGFDPFTENGFTFFCF